MKVKQHLVAKTAALFLAAGLFACGLDEIDGDIKNPNVEATFGAPVGTSSITVEDIIGDFEGTGVTIEPDNSGLLIATEDGDSIGYNNIGEIVSFDDMSNSNDIAPGISAIAVGESIEESFSQDLKFEYPISDDGELDSMVYSQGRLSLSLTSTFDVDLEYVFTIEDIKSRANELPITFTGTVEAGGTIDDFVDLANYRVQANWELINTEDADPNNDVYANVFNGDFVGTLRLEDGEQVLATQSVEYSIDITNADFQTIYGYFGRKSVSIAELGTEIGLFENIDENTIRFESPELRINTYSSFGLPFGLNLDDVQSTSISGNIVSLTGTVTESPNIVRKVALTDKGETVVSVTTIDASNSNIVDLLSSSPVSVDLNITGETNSGVGDSSLFTNRNFVDQESFISVSTDLVVPFVVQMNNFNREIEFDLFNTDVRDADTIYVRINTLNNMPVTGTINLRILGAEEQVLHEQGETVAIISPTFDSAGKIEIVGDTLVEIPLFGDGLVAFETAERMVFDLNVSSSGIEDGDYVKLFSDYGIEFILSLEAAINSDLGL